MKALTALSRGVWLALACGMLLTGGACREAGHKGPVSSGGLANPAVEKCREDGFRAVAMVKNGTPSGYLCINDKTGESCEAWSYFRDECSLQGKSRNKK